MTDKNKDDFNFGMITADEWDFIRRQAGITYEQIARRYSRGSRSTPYYWRKTNAYMKVFQVKILKELIPKEVWEDARVMWQKLQIGKENEVT